MPTLKDVFTKVKDNILDDLQSSGVDIKVEDWVSQKPLFRTSDLAVVLKVQRSKDGDDVFIYTFAGLFWEKMYDDDHNEVRGLTAGNLRTWIMRGRSEDQQIWNDNEEAKLAYEADRNGTATEEQLAKISQASAAQKDKDVEESLIYDKVQRSVETYFNGLYEQNRSAATFAKNNLFVAYINIESNEIKIKHAITDLEMTTDFEFSRPNGYLEATLKTIAAPFVQWEDLDINTEF